MSYRSDLDALAARHAALEGEVADAQQRRDEARQLLEDARALSNLRVASPCLEAWADMPGDDRVRACGKCLQHVYNLSEMTYDEAAALIREREGRLCVRYYQRSDGTILLADCEVGRRGKRKRRWVAAGIAASLAAAVGVGASEAHVSRDPVPERDQLSLRLGDVASSGELVPADVAGMMMGGLGQIPHNDDTPVWARGVDLHEPPPPPVRVPMKL